MAKINGYFPLELHKLDTKLWDPPLLQRILHSKFASSEEHDYILQEGPCFCWTAWLSITPWFPYFDESKMVVSRLSLWVRLHNLPLHFWHHKVLEGINNLLGRYIKLDTKRVEERIFTFAKICVEVDLSKGLLDHILLTHKNQYWTQSLDFENTAFWCRICWQTGHLQNTCPEAKKEPRSKKKPGK